MFRCHIYICNQGSVILHKMYKYWYYMHINIKSNPNYLQFVLIAIHLDCNSSNWLTRCSIQCCPEPQRWLFLHNCSAWSVLEKEEKKNIFILHFHCNIVDNWRAPCNNVIRPTNMFWQTYCTVSGDLDPCLAVKKCYVFNAIMIISSFGNWKILIRKNNSKINTVTFLETSI